MHLGDRRGRVAQRGGYPGRGYYFLFPVAAGILAALCFVEAEVNPVSCYVGATVCSSPASGNLLFALFLGTLSLPGTLLLLLSLSSAGIIYVSLPGEKPPVAHLDSETVVQVGFVWLGFLLLASVIALADLWQSTFVGTLSPSTGNSNEILWVVGITALLAGSAFVGARGFWYPEPALPTDTTVLLSRTRAKASTRSKVGEVVSWTWLLGGALLLLGIILQVLGFDIGFCHGSAYCGPTNLAPVSLAFTIEGLIALGTGVGLLLARGYLGGPPRPRGLGTGAPR
jgi:hypothetical protein